MDYIISEIRKDGDRKLTVFGATGGTGAGLVRQAPEARHDVLSVVRDPARLRTGEDPHLRVVTADVMAPAAIQDGVTGADAVVSALGSRNPRAKTRRARTAPAGSSPPCGRSARGGCWS